MGRAPCCEKIGLKKGRWTTEEDDILTNYIQANGEGSWRSLPKNAGLLRCGKSCRLRWINYLRADLKRGNISSAEEDIIINLHASLGNKWSLIASHLPGRTDNEIKNYWNSHLSRKIETYRRHISNDFIPMAMDLSKVNTNPSKPKGKTSRWAMKKNKNSLTQKSTSGSTKKPKEAKFSSITAGITLPITPTITEKETININEHMSSFENLPSYQNRANETSMFCPSFENGSKLISGATCNEGDDIYDGELSFNDIVVDDELLCQSGVPIPLTSIEERQSNYLLNHHISEERDNGVDSWDWESVLEDGQELWDEKMLSWLWENEDNWENTDANKFQEVADSEKQNATVAWLLS